MTPPRDPRSAVSRYPTRLLVLLALLLVGTAGAATALGVAVTRDDDDARAKPVAELSQVQASCRGWMMSPTYDIPSASASGDASGNTSGDPLGDLADDAWCDDMFTWMDAQPHGSMMGSGGAGWQGPAEMGATCREWLSQDDADSAARDPQQCAAMTDWMNEHLSGQGMTWMMQDR